jgi:hypothetical protein
MLATRAIVNKGLARLESRESPTLRYLIFFFWIAEYYVEIILYDSGKLYS